MKTLIVEGFEVLLDDYDWLRMCRYKWKIRSPKDGVKYICRNTKISGRRFTVYMHRSVMCPPYGLDLPKDQEVHHKHDNPLDNRKDELEVVSRSAHNNITHGSK